MKRFRTILYVTACVALLLRPRPAEACQIPVFRYAMWRWPASSYRIILFHRGALSPQQSTWAGELKQACEQETKPVNAGFEDVNLADASAGRTAESWEALKFKDELLPAVVVVYPGSETFESVPKERQERLRSAWAETLSADTPKTLFHSPLRAQVARDLVEANAAVFVLVKSGNTKQDEQAQTALRAVLIKMEGELQMPAGDPAILWAENLQGLKITFGLRVVDRKDPAEARFLGMALSLAPRIDAQIAAGHPAIIPLYGRARALTPYLADDKEMGDITTSISQMVTGACSCEIKEMNPGVDLLFAVNWEHDLQTFAAKRAEATTAPATPLEPPSLADLAASPPAMARKPETKGWPTIEVGKGGTMPRNVTLLAASVAGMVVVWSAWWTWRRKRSQ